MSACVWWALGRNCWMGCRRCTCCCQWALLRWKIRNSLNRWYFVAFTLHCFAASYTCKCISHTCIHTNTRTYCNTYVYVVSICFCLIVLFTRCKKRKLGAYNEAYFLNALMWKDSAHSNYQTTDFQIRFIRFIRFLIIFKISELVFGAGKVLNSYNELSNYLLQLIE